MSTVEITGLTLTEILTPEKITDIAKETGFLKRLNKISPFEFLMILVFRTSDSYPAALRFMVSFIEKSVSRSGLHQRFNENAADFVKHCLQETVRKQVIKDYPVPVKLLDTFNRVLIHDSSGWDVSPQLKEIYAGSGGNASEANCKLQFCYDYKTGSFILFEDRKGTEPDQKYGKQIKDIVNEGDLILRDLGYSSYEIFDGIHRKRAYFCSRFHTASDVWQLHNGEYIRLDFEKVLKPGHNISVELNVFLKGKKNEYLPIRLTAFRVPEEIGNIRRSRLHKQGVKKGRTCSPKNLYLCGWSIFVTNAPESLIPSKMIRSIYRIRWSTELVFKNWKSVLKIHVSSVKKNHCRLKCELYAKLIPAVMVHTVHQKVQHYSWITKKKKSVLTVCGNILSQEQNPFMLLQKNLCLNSRLQ